MFKDKQANINDAKQNAKRALKFNLLLRSFAIKRSLVDWRVLVKSMASEGIEKQAEEVTQIEQADSDRFRFHWTWNFSLLFFMMMLLMLLFSLQYSRWKETKEFNELM